MEMINVTCPNCGCEIHIESTQPEPSEITDEQAILHLQSTGWMQNHDREMYESGLKKRLADDSGDYDSLIPCEDTISRQQAITALRALSDDDGYINAPHEVVTDVVRGLPPVKVKQGQTTQPERGKTDKLGVKTGGTWVDVTCPNCGCEIHVESAQPEPCEDFVKVVRCKKCRYVYRDKEFDNYWCNRMSGTFMVEAEGFCKWGR